MASVRRNRKMERRRRGRMMKMEMGRRGRRITVVEMGVVGKEGQEEGMEEREGLPAQATSSRFSSALPSPISTSRVGLLLLYRSALFQK